MPRVFGIPHEQAVPYRPAPVTAVVCVHIPSFSGYYLERMEILKVCLASLRTNAGADLDLMVVDNGSHPAVKQFLQRQVVEGQIRHLISHAENLGKGRALNMAFRAVRSEYIAYSDDDVLFFPNWLVEELSVHQRFPNVAIVGGQPVPDNIGYEAALRAARAYGLRSGPYRLPHEQLRRWAKSIGYEVENYVGQETVRQRLSQLLLLECDGIQAVTGCAFYQGLFRRELVDQMPLLREGVGVGREDVEWREEAARRGFLLLNTVRQVTHHLGNRIDDEDAALVRSCGVNVRGAPQWRKALDVREWEYRLRRTHLFALARPIVRLIRRSSGGAPDG